MPKPEHQWIDLPGAPSRIPFAQNDRLRPLPELAATSCREVIKIGASGGDVMPRMMNYLLGSLVAQHKNAAEFFYRQVEGLDEQVPKELLLQMFYDYGVRAFQQLLGQDHL